MDGCQGVAMWLLGCSDLMCECLCVLEVPGSRNENLFDGLLIVC